MATTLTHLERIVVVSVGWQVACAKRGKLHLLHACPSFESTDARPLPPTLYECIQLGERALDLNETFQIVREEEYRCEEEYRR